MRLPFTVPTLTLEGFKAPVENPKKTMTYPSFRKLTGALARLGEPANGTIGLAEGIETAMAVREATGQVCGRQPVLRCWKRPFCLETSVG
jgi:hypothetical protein